MNPVEQNEYDKYLSYLNSRKWAELRDQALQRDEFHCVICNNPHNLEVHHLRYPDVLGTEPLSDLMTLCRECHKNMEEYKKGHRRLRKVEWHPPRKEITYWIKANAEEDINRIEKQYKDNGHGLNRVSIYWQEEKIIKTIWLSDDALNIFKETEDYKETSKWI